MHDKAFQRFIMKWLSLITIIVTAGTLTDFTQGENTYLIKKVNGKLPLTGKGNDPAWYQAPPLTDFRYPWEDDAPPPTTFRALHNDDWVYFLFVVEDDDVNIRTATNQKTEVAASSRAEIFFRIDEKLTPYYCLEIDPLARVLDYEARYHRNFDTSWSWPKDQLVIKTEQRADGYSVEFAISKKSLQALKLLKDNALEAGLFRANCVFRENGEPDFKWISWLQPDAATPDFHIPSSFGILRLEE